MGFHQTPAFWVIQKPSLSDSARSMEVWAHTRDACQRSSQEKPGCGEVPWREVGYILATDKLTSQWKSLFKGCSTLESKHLDLGTFIVQDSFQLKHDELKFTSLTSRIS